MEEQQKLIAKFTEWAKQEKEILAAVLVGSHARDTAKDDSDIDLIIITQNPRIFLSENSWIDRLGSVSNIKSEDYKFILARRVFYANGIEVEFGITTPDWLKRPIDSGTKRVLSDGYKVLDDKAGLFKSLTNAGL